MSIKRNIGIASLVLGSSLFVEALRESVTPEMPRDLARVSEINQVLGSDILEGFSYTQYKHYGSFENYAGERISMMKLLEAERDSLTGFKGYAVSDPERVEAFSQELTDYNASTQRAGQKIILEASLGGILAIGGIIAIERAQRKRGK